MYRTTRLSLAASTFAVALSAGVLGACADDPAPLGASLNEAPLTLAEGHKFLVRIDGDRVVLERKVGTHPLPFTDKEFVGKNIVIHPKSSGTGEDGLFARVLRVEDAGKRVELVVRPLELHELANAARNGDDTLTLYKNTALRDLPSSLAARPSAGAGTYGAGSIGTLSLPQGNLKLATDPSTPAEEVTVPWPPSLSSMGALNSLVTGGATTKFRDVDFSFEPGLSGRWIEDRGVELGARLSLSTKMKIDIDALVMAGSPAMVKIGNRDLISITSAGPITLIEVPVLLGGVYTTIGVRAAVGCYARVEQHFKGTIVVDIAAKIEGSAVFEISPSSAAEKWITEGDTPFSATGHADVTLDHAEGDIKPSIFCELPKLSVYVQPGGKVLDAIGGPQVVLSSVGKFYAAWENEPAFSVAVTGAVTAKPLGKQLTAETTLLEWKP